MKKLFSVVAFTVLAASACRSAPGPGRAHKAAPTGSEAKAGFANIQKLAGNWEGTAFGMKATAVFAGSSAGSTVREIMAPGGEHEMTNMYHLDGDQIVVTHYCGAGNQPRMVSTMITPGRIVFELDDISNYTGGPHGYMGRLELEFVNKDHVIQHWTNFDSPETGTAVFDLKRVK